ncbi:MAG: c-type cytochrome, partial [Planctomycetota bacterium]
IAQVFAFLSEIDKTGVGQARQPSGTLTPDKFKSLVNAAEMSAQQKAGRDVFMGMCTACHKPLEDALVGSTVAPDPTKMATELKASEILEVLDAGRPDKGMPAFAIKGDRATEIVAFLQWLAEQRDELQKQQGDADAGVPWFEYE